MGGTLCSFYNVFAIWTICMFLQQFIDSINIPVQRNITRVRALQQVLKHWRCLPPTQSVTVHHLSAWWYVRTYFIQGPCKRDSSLVAGGLLALGLVSFLPCAYFLYFLFTDDIKTPQEVADHLLKKADMLTVIAVGFMGMIGCVQRTCEMWGVMQEHLNELKEIQIRAAIMKDGRGGGGPSVEGVCELLMGSIEKKDSPPEILGIACTPVFLRILMGYVTTIAFALLIKLVPIAHQAYRYISP